MKGTLGALLCLFHIGMIILSDFVHAEDEQEVIVPEKIFAARHTTAHLPCMSSAPPNKMKFEVKDESPSLKSRMNIINQAGVPNLIILDIKDVEPEDSGEYACVVGDSSEEIELVVFDTSFPTVAVGVTSSNDVNVKWNRPAGPKEAVIGYKIFVTEVAQSVGVASFDVGVDPLSEDGTQEFLLADLKPGAIYDIEVSVVYLVGPVDEGDTIIGPKSAKVRINTPYFSSPPVMVKVVPWRDSTILVTWNQPPNIDPKAIDGYIVDFTRYPMKKSSPTGALNVTSPGDDGQWKAVLKGLKTRTRYEIAVRAIQNDVVGKKSQAVIFRHDGFAPEISVTAIPLGPDTAMVTLDTVGAKNVTKLRVLYSDDTATKWTRIKDCLIGDHCIVSGLQPRSKYYFSARARVDKKSRHAVTHIVTPPSALDKPVDLKVTAKTDSSINAEWTYESQVMPIGYILQMEFKETRDAEFRPFRQQVVMGDQKTEVWGLMGDDQYRGQVVPFDGNGLGVPSESVLFSIGDAVVVDQSQVNSSSSPIQFVEVPAALMEVDAGEDVTLPCTAVGGSSYPTVQWLDDNEEVISGPRAGRNVLFLPDVIEPMTVTCQASNNFQMVFHSTHIDVSHGLASLNEEEKMSKPVLAEPLPSEVKKKSGELLHLGCSFKGEPVPMVRWSQDGRPIGEWTTMSSALVIPSVENSAVLTCEGMNVHGLSSHTVLLEVEEGRDPLGPRIMDYILTLRALRMSPSEVTFKWAVDQGDIDAIRGFDVTLATDSGLELMTKQMKADQRSITLGELTPSVTYVVTLKTITAEGLVDETAMTISKNPDAPIIDEPVVMLEVVEVRHNKVRVDFTALTPIQSYRLRLKDLGGRKLGNTIMDKTVDGKSTSINLERLKPNREYLIILDAMTKRGHSLTTQLIFLTSSPGEAGYSVASRSDDKMYTTAAPMTTTTMTITEPTITTVLTTPATRFVHVAAATTHSPMQDDDYDLKVRTAYKTPYQVVIRWTVNRGDLDAINNFYVTIKKSPKHILLQQQLRGEDRSISIQSLTPNTRYYVNVKARSRVNSVQAEADIIVITPSSDAETDKSNPVLDLEANEIRSNKARIEWTLVNGDVRQLSGFTLKVLDRDMNGQNLLTQNMVAQARTISLMELPPNRQYYVIMDALDRSRNVMASSSLTFSTPSPGRYGVPVKANRSSQQGGQQPAMTTQNPRPLIQEAVLDMEIRPMLPNGAKLNWKLYPGGGNPVREYLVIVRHEDANGQLLLRQPFPVSSTYYQINKLQSDTTYFIELEAMDRRRKTIAKVSSTYRLPPPGHKVEPVKATSASTNGNHNNGDNHEQQEKLSIIFVNALNSTAVMLGWRNPSPVLPSAQIYVRYAEYEKDSRRGFTIKYALAAQERSTISGLEPGKTYGFQIAKPVPKGMFMQWSDLVLHKTDV